MLKLRYIFILITLLLFNGSAFPQTIEGLKDIVSFQQEKISRIEDNLKKLVGLIEEQTNLKNPNDNLKLIEKQINDINEKLRLFENNIKNITNLTYDLDFALKRIERYLELSSIKSGKNKISDTETKDITDYKVEKKAEITKNNLDAKTSGVLGFVKEENPKEEEEKERKVLNHGVNKKK